MKIHLERSLFEQEVGCWLAMEYGNGRIAIAVAEQPIMFDDPQDTATYPLDKRPVWKFMPEHLIELHRTMTSELRRLGLIAATDAEARCLELERAIAEARATTSQLLEVVRAAVRRPVHIHTDADKVAVVESPAV